MIRIRLFLNLLAMTSIFVVSACGVAPSADFTSTPDRPAAIPTTCELLMETNAHYTSIERVVFTPDGTRLVSGSYDGTISVWGIAEPSSP